MLQCDITQTLEPEQWIHVVRKWYGKLYSVFATGIGYNQTVIRLYHINNMLDAVTINTYICGITHICIAAKTYVDRRYSIMGASCEKCHCEIIS